MSADEGQARRELREAVEGLTTIWGFALSNRERLSVLALVHDVTADAIREQVKYDRDCGRTWAQIAADLGITRQGAAQRFGGES